MNATVQSETVELVQNAGAATREHPPALRWRTHALRLCILVLASYGLFYFTYKFNRPWPGSNDYYYNYYYMYLSPLNAKAAPAPYILRQISAAITHLVLVTHIYVHNSIALPVPGFNPRVLFAAMLSNWGFLILAAWLAGLIAEEELGQRNGLVAVVAGFLCLLAFQTPFFILSGLTEGLNWFLLAAGFLAYARKSRRWLLLVLALSIVQRESISIVLGAIAACDLMLTREDRRFKLQALAAAIACFGVYFLARRFGFQGSDGQTHLTGMLASLQHPAPARTFLSQMVFTQNIAILFFAVALFGRKGVHLRRVWLPCLLAAMIVLDAIGVAAGIVDNLSRVVAILVPILAGLAAAGLWQQRHRLE